MNAIPAAREEFSAIPLRLSWWTLLKWAAFGELVFLVITMVALRDLLALALVLIVLFGLGLLMLRRLSGSLLSLGMWGALDVAQLRFPHAWLGVIVLGLVFADIAVYTVTGAFENLRSGADWMSVAMAAVLATCAVTGVIAVIAIVLKRGHADAPSVTAHNVALGALLALILVLTLGGFTSQRAHAAPRPASLNLVTENMGYSKTALVAKASPVILGLENHDLFWHTFTIPELGVDLQVPMRGRQQIQFNAPPGTYTFFCTIPGHELLGMQGTLTVK